MKETSCYLLDLLLQVTIKVVKCRLQPVNSFGFCEVLENFRFQKLCRNWKVKWLKKSYSHVGISSSTQLTPLTLRANFVMFSCFNTMCSANICTTWIRFHWSLKRYNDMNYTHRWASQDADTWARSCQVRSSVSMFLLYVHFLYYVIHIIQN